jgi:putative solute:sodium symporter small subunit
MQTDYSSRAGRRPATWLDLVDAARQRLPWLGLKNLVLVMLAIWIVYFAAIHTFVRTLNKIDVPVLELPLGVFLAIQGAVIVFGIALYMFTKKRRAFGLT